MVLKVVAVGMPRPHAEQLIHQLAAEGKFGWSPDFKIKLDVREIGMRLVIEALKGGSINQGPVKDEYGDWRCRVRRKVAGRLIRVIVAIVDENHLELISAY
jgi:hypothetical protein